MNSGLVDSYTVHRCYRNIGRKILALKYKATCINWEGRADSHLQWFDISLVVLGLVICKNSSTLVLLFYEETPQQFRGARFKYGSACPLWSNNSNLQRIHKITRNIYREAHCFKGGWRLEGQVKWSVFLVTLKWRFNMDGILWEGKIGSLS